VLKVSRNSWLSARPITLTSQNLGQSGKLEGASIGIRCGEARAILLDSDSPGTLLSITLHPVPLAKLQSLAT
jgi:hypothetical protein